VQPIAEWLANIGLERYAPAFADNDIDVSVLPHLNDADLEKIGVSLGHRRKMLAAVARLIGGDHSLPQPTITEPKPGQTAERRHGAVVLSDLVGTTALSGRMDPEGVREAFPLSSRLRPAEMIGGRFLPSAQTASDDRCDGDIQAGEIGEAYGDYDDLPNPRWRGRLGTVVVVLCLAGLGAGGAFAYRAVLAGAVLPTLPPIIKARNGANGNVPNSGDAPPSNLSQTSRAGSSEKFVSRWPEDSQEPPKTAPISPDPSAPLPGALGSGQVAPIATAPAVPPPAAAPPALPAPAPVPALPSSTSKKIHTVVSRSDGSGQTDTRAPAGKSAAAKPSAAAARVVGNQPLSLVPDAQDHAAASPRSRSGVPVNTRIAAEASPGGGYAVAVASERSAADAEAVFRSLQAKFPNQLGGREPIVRRTDLGPEGIYYQASIGPFVSMKAAAGVCSSLKAAGESCLVEKN
jgi:hypothetical protein